MIIAANKLNMHIVVSSPNKKDFIPNQEFIKGFKYQYEQDPKKAALGSDVIYTDTWMSYHIPEKKAKKRSRILKNYQVNNEIMNMSKKDSIFMHCLPAKRGQEVTDKVMDSEKSVIYDQAENRKWAEMAILIKLLS